MVACVCLGAAQHHLKEAFLTELVQLCSKDTLPILIGGDFNIIEKNNANYNNRWPFLFNAIIDAFNLRELELSGRQFTWASNLEIPTFEKLDRILSCTEWELNFPRTTIQALSRDHTPLFINTWKPASNNNQSLFKFELGWLLREGFMDLVTEIWHSVDEGHNSLEHWQPKIRCLHQYLKGWAKNTSGAYMKENKRLLEKWDELDKKAESTLLHQNELNLEHVLNEILSELLREEEIKWYQRAKVNNLLEGDTNTKYFQLIANGKHRKTRIFRLE
jgi:hypothetical protein